MRAKPRQTRVAEKNFIESTDSKGLGGWRQDVPSFGGCIAAAHCKMPQSSSHLRNSQQVTRPPHSFAQAQDLRSHRPPAPPLVFAAVVGKRQLKLEPLRCGLVAGGASNCWRCRIPGAARCCPCVVDARAFTAVLAIDCWAVACDVAAASASSW